jgi:quercetin dioxygenase-like cupin family protein
MLHVVSDGYFEGGGARRHAGSTGSYHRIDDQQVVDASPGVHLRAVPGQQLMLSWVAMDPDSEAPVHTHDEEQMGVVLSGSCEFVLDGVARRLARGDVYLAPPGVPHGARTSARACVIVDVFSPPRAALLALLRTPADEERPPGG